MRTLRVLVRARTLDGEDFRGEVQYRNATRIAEDHTVTLNMAAEYPSRDGEQVTPYFQSGDRPGVFVDIPGEDPIYHDREIESEEIGRILLFHLPPRKEHPDVHWKLRFTRELHTV